MEKIRLVALGGLDEDGKNMYCLEIDNDIFVIEAGLKYPNESDKLGVEYIIPDFSYLVKNKDRVKGIFISHAHDDVMQALGHLLEEVDAEVYATQLTARLLQYEFKEIFKKKRINILKRKDKVNVAGHNVYTFPVLQSIADGVGFAFETDSGLVVYSSEFIVDYDFSNQAFSMDVSTVTEIGKKDVLLLMSESTGAHREGYTAPRHRIYNHIEPYIENLDNRLIITLYRQNLYRIIEILELCKKNKKKIFFYDDDLVKLLKQVADLGYYRFPESLLVNKRDFNNDLKEVVCIVSGSGYNVFKLVNKIAIGEDSIITLNEDDTVVIASPIVPGTEKVASNMENDLYKANVKVIKMKAKELLSMHASTEDLKMMLYLIKPKYYVPVKGQYSSLIANADIAVEMGYTPDKIIVLDNGQFADFQNGKLVSTRDTIELNELLIDGSNKTDVAGMVLKDRETLSTDGAIVIGVVLDFKTKELIGGPDIQSRGVIYLKDAEDILTSIGQILIDTIKEAVEEDRYDNMHVRMEAKERINKFVLKETGKRPMILPAIVEINAGE